MRGCTSTGALLGDSRRLAEHTEMHLMTRTRKCVLRDVSGALCLWGLFGLLTVDGWIKTTCEITCHLLCKRFDKLDGKI